MKSKPAEDAEMDGIDNTVKEEWNKKRALNADKELAWLLFGNEEESEMRVNTHILQSDIDSIIMAIEERRESCDKSSDIHAFID